MTSTTITFDDTTATITTEGVTIVEGDFELVLTFASLTHCLVVDAQWNMDGFVRAGSVDRWTADRVVYMASLAGRKLAQLAMAA